MKRIFIAILLLSISFNLFAGTKRRIAVLDLDAKGVTTAEAEAVADFLRTDLVNTGKFSVVERTKMQAVLKEQELSLSGVTIEDEKVSRIGQLLNCDLLMVGTLSKLGEKYFLNTRVVDVKTGEVVLGKRESSETMEYLSEISRKIASQLAGIKYVPKMSEDVNRKKTSLNMSSSELAGRINVYNNSKKRAGTAFCLSFFLIPGSGHFYVGEWGRGLLFLGLDTSLFILAFTLGIEEKTVVDPYWGTEYSEYSYNSIYYLSFGTITLLRIIEYVDVFAAVKRYNRRLRKQLGLPEDFELSMNFTPYLDIHNKIGYNLGLSYKF